MKTRLFAVASAAALAVGSITECTTTTTSPRATDSPAAKRQSDTRTAQQAVIGYVLTKGGLMANLSLDGTKFTPLAI